MNRDEGVDGALAGQSFSTTVSRPRRCSRRHVVIGLCAFGAFACGAARTGSKVPLPPPEESTALGPGDVFTLQIVGEKTAPVDLQVASDGTVEAPYMHTLKVAGLEPQEVSRLIRNWLMEHQVYTDPSIIVRVTEYRSKQISVLGQVQRPGSFPFQPGMTFVQGVSLAGGLNAIAKTHHIRLTRRLRKGGSVTVLLDFEAITSGSGEDPMLQAGDHIFVEERVF